VTGSDAAEAVLEANDAFYRAFNEKSLPAMEAVWASSEDVTCIHPGWNLLRGHSMVMESWKAILSNPNQPRVLSGGATVNLAGDVALVICRELVGGIPLAATNVFTLEEGAWRLLHHHSGPVEEAI
jgi:ketosteroid isomerase-like protein